MTANLIAHSQRRKGIKKKPHYNNNNNNNTYINIIFIILSMFEQCISRIHE